MATKTKYELIQINAQLATDNSALRQQVSLLKVDLEIARGAKPFAFREQACLLLDIADPIGMRSAS